MTENGNPSDLVRSAMLENLGQARLAINNYFQFFEKSMSASPWGATDQAKTFTNYVEQTVAANFELSDKLLHAKDVQEIVRIQTDFFQSQLRTLTEQSKNLREPATNAPPDVAGDTIK